MDERSVIEQLIKQAQDEIKQITEGIGQAQYQLLLRQSFIQGANNRLAELDAAAAEPKVE